MLEKHLERKVVAHCKANDILCYKFTSPARRGVPDRLMVKNGKVMFMELKKKGEAPTKLQWHEILALGNHGAHVAWADNFENAAHIIDQYYAA
jgi:hypothetical protein